MDESDHYRPYIRLPATDDELFADCDMQTFRAGGPGGQHQNTTDSAVRLVHRPTGITVSCREERSQHLNRRRCLEKLREVVARRNRRPAKRLATRVSRNQKARNRRAREAHSQKKRQRRPPRLDD